MCVRVLNLKIKTADCIQSLFSFVFNSVCHRHRHFLSHRLLWSAPVVPSELLHGSSGYRQSLSPPFTAQPLHRELQSGSASLAHQHPQLAHQRPALTLPRHQLTHGTPFHERRPVLQQHGLQTEPESAGMTSLSSKAYASVMNRFTLN